MRAGLLCLATHVDTDGNPPLFVTPDGLISDAPGDLVGYPPRVVRDEAMRIARRYVVGRDWYSRADRHRLQRLLRANRRARRLAAVDAGRVRVDAGLIVRPQHGLYTLAEAPAATSAA